MTDNEFQVLMAMQKHVIDDIIMLPKQGEVCAPVNVVSDSTSDAFNIDLDRRGTITLSKKKLQERYLNNPMGMVRLEIDAPPHINPDGRRLSRNHIHIWQKKYGMAMAYELDEISDTLFKNIHDFTSVFYDFCEFCNIDLSTIEIQGVT